MTERSWNPAEAERLAELARTAILDTPPEPRFDAICAAVRTICDVPTALVSLVDRERQWFKARSGFDRAQTSIDTSVCALAIRQSQLFVIPDLAADTRTRAMSLVTGDPGIRFYAGFPIVTGDGVAIGSVCAIDTQPRPAGLSAEQGIALEALARQAAVEVEHGPNASAAVDATLPFSNGSFEWEVAARRLTGDRRFATLLGVEPAVLAAGLTADDFVARLHPDDVERVTAATRATIADRVPFACEYRLMVDGRPRWVLAQGRLIRERDGSPLRLVGASFDIDARRQAENRLEALLRLNDRLRETSGDAADLAFAAAEVMGETLGTIRAGYGRIDPDAETVEMARQYTDRGAQPLPPLLHFRDYGDFIDELKRGETVVISDVARDARTAAHAAEIAAFGIRSLVNIPLVEDGRFVALLVVNDDRPRRWEADEILFLREVAERTRHAVERRRSEEELAQLNASLEAEVAARTRALIEAEERLRQSLKMEAVGQLTGGLAHDFNNLLTGISGALELIQLRIRQGRTDTLARYADGALANVARAAALTHRLLAFSRRQTLAPRATDVNALVAGMEELVQRTVGPAYRVDLDHDDALWTALVDGNQLENALLNLCINARDAMPDGGTIRIETANVHLDAAEAADRELPPGDYLALSVTDGGVGMSAEVQARVFDPFFTTKPMGAGTGLGLSMIYGFARQSGGQVRIRSAPGEGTTVSLYLPRHHGAPEAADDVGLGEDAAEPFDRARTVLVVDDEASVRLLVAEAVAEDGHHIVEAEDGAQALALIADGARFDLLVTDVGLPGGINGRQVADAALAAHPDLPVVFITGYAEQAVLDRAPLGPNMALLTKPFPLETLSSRVRTMLRN